MFERVLVANRGEIACRVMRTCRALGIRAIAVYSDADREAMHVRTADEAWRIGEAPAARSYLDIEAILDVARRARAEAIHPGYGFLAENADFARACAAAGIVFVGPTPEALEAMGDKARARRLMAEAGVPVVPGAEGPFAHDADVAKAARRLGFPLLIKAAAGGGGRGMRLVRGAGRLADELAAARREALGAFGDGRVLLERYLDAVRHIEVQVFGDRHGSVVHLFERDCSVQRRHQKVIEEAPAPGLDEALRKALGEAAVRAARAVGYVGAGTIEFLLDAQNAFFFLEMNTRLQVEHPVTEMITGHDLVAWQLQVAARAPLPCRQQDIAIRGHAIEARLYAEDPGHGSVPTTGRLAHLSLPAAESVRVDAGYEASDVVPAHYDTLIAKLIAWGPDREQAIRRLRRGMGETLVAGPATNLELLERLLAHPAFERGGVDTGFLERELGALVRPTPVPTDGLALAALRLLADQDDAAAKRRSRSADPTSPWHRSDAWRLNASAAQVWRLHDGRRARIVTARAEDGGHRLEIDGEVVRARILAAEPDRLRAEIDGRALRALVARQGDRLVVVVDEGRFALTVVDPLHAAMPERERADLLTAPMPARIVRVLVAEGDNVDAGQGLVVLEAMKMEHRVTAPAPGRVAKVNVVEGAQVAEGAVLLDLEVVAEPESEAAS